MNAHPRVIAYLQRALAHEFAAAEQLTLQAVQATALGLARLTEGCRQGAREELEHAEAFASRLLAVGAMPQAVTSRTPPVGRTHEELLRFGLATEAAAIRLYREAVDYCRRIGDGGNAVLFARILDDEIAHYRELEQALGRFRPREVDHA